MGIMVYNSLPPEIKDLSHNIKKFKSSLRGFYKIGNDNINSDVGYLYFIPTYLYLIF